MRINPALVWDYPIPKKQNEPFRRWYIARVLVRGGDRDVRSLGLKTIRRYLPVLNLPPAIRAFWTWYLRRSA